MSSLHAEAIRLLSVHAKQLLQDIDAARYDPHPLISTQQQREFAQDPVVLNHLAALKAAEDDLEAVHQLVLTGLAKIRSQTADLRGRTVPINVLPAEVVRRIFLVGIPLDINQRYKYAFAVSQVSMGWRRVAKEQSALWNVVRNDWPLEFIQLAIQRSSNQPLHLIYGPSGTFRSPPQALFAPGRGQRMLQDMLAIQNTIPLERCVSVNLFGVFFGLGAQVLGELLPKMTNVTQLQLTREQIGEMTMHHMTAPFYELLPNVKSVRVRNSNDSILEQCLSINILELTIDHRASVETFTVIFSRAQRLQVLRLQDGFKQPEPDLVDFDEEGEQLDADEDGPETGDVPMQDGEPPAPAGPAVLSNTPSDIVIPEDNAPYESEADTVISSGNESSASTLVIGSASAAAPPPPPPPQPATLTVAALGLGTAVLANTPTEPANTPATANNGGDPTDEEEELIFFAPHLHTLYVDDCYRRDLDVLSKHLMAPNLKRLFIFASQADRESQARHAEPLWRPFVASFNTVESLHLLVEPVELPILLTMIKNGAFPHLRELGASHYEYSNRPEEVEPDIFDVLVKVLQEMRNSREGFGGKALEVMYLNTPNDQQREVLYGYVGNVIFDGNVRSRWADRLSFFSY